MPWEQVFLQISTATVISTRLKYQGKVNLLGVNSQYMDEKAEIQLMIQYWLVTEMASGHKTLCTKSL